MIFYQLSIMCVGRYTAGYEVPLVRGMPYVTVFFTSLTPVLKFAHAVLSVTGSGSRYQVSLNNGQEWLVYTAPALSLTQAGDYVSAGERFTGSVRVACVKGYQGDVDTLDTYSGKIPLGGRISAVASGESFFAEQNLSIPYIILLEAVSLLIAVSTFLPKYDPTI